MATSGTWNFNLDLTDVFEDAYEQIGSELRSGYDYVRARRALNMLLLDWQNRGLNLWTMKQGTQTLTAGSSSYQLDAERLEVVDIALRTGTGTSQLDRALRRMSSNDYLRQSNKAQTGVPNSYWIAHSPDSITINLWPVPDSQETYTLYYHYLERIEDAGNVGSNNIDVPPRFLPAMTTGLAYFLALRTPGELERALGLKIAYDEFWKNATEAARDRASFFIRPKVAR